jgi:hypothetical protein
MLRMVSYSHRPKSGQITCYLNRTYHALTTCTEGRVANSSILWETVGMSKKRTKADTAQRQADQLEKKASRRPAQNRKEKASREDQAAARIVKQATEDK